MLVGAREIDPPGQRSGCVALAKSRDLYNWKLAPPLWAPRIGPHTDCPQLIRENGRWYLIYLQRHTRYRFADSLEGPWRRPPIRDIGSRFSKADSRLASDGKRWISFPHMAGFGKDAVAVGTLAMPRQWEFHDDGSITQHVPPEILEAMRALPAEPAPPLQDAEPLVGSWDLGVRNAAVSGDPSGGTLMLRKDTPRDFYLEMNVTLEHQDMEMHLIIDTQPDPTTGWQLSICPRRNLAWLRPISYWDPDAIVESVPVEIEADRPFSLRVFRAGEIVIIFIDDKAEIAHGIGRTDEGRLLLELRDGAGAFRDVLLRRLRP